MARLNRVMLIDDDVTANFLHRGILTDLSLCKTLSIESSGTNAIRTLNRCSPEENTPTSFPDMLLIDYRMPLMTGFEFVDEISPLLASIRKKVVVCILTADEQSATRLQAHDSPYINGFLYKPLNSLQMIDIINRHFS